MCHMPNGLGRPENAPIAGLPYTYVVQQLSDFKNDLRTSAEPRKTNTAQMIQAAKAMTDEEVKAAATYLSSLKWKPWIKVVEADTVPHMRLSGNVFFAIGDGETEPLGKRIVETPLDNTRFELRDPHSGFTAYVPTGSLSQGCGHRLERGNKTLPCGICHGQDLNGLGPVPGIAGRSPSYIVRQLYDIQQGTRKGTWSPLMKQVVDKLTQDDMIAIAAYIASGDRNRESVSVSAACRGRSGGASGEVQGAFSLQEGDRARNLVEPVHPSSTEIQPSNFTSPGAEDGVVVVEPLAGFAVAQRRRRSRASRRRSQIVERRARREVAIGGVHRHDPVLHLLQEADRIEAADEGVGRIVLHAEERRVDLLDDLEEDVFGLRELGIPPGAVLVVVLHAQDDVALLGVLERAADALDRAGDASLRDMPG